MRTVCSTGILAGAFLAAFTQVRSFCTFSRTMGTVILECGAPAPLLSFSVNQNTYRRRFGVRVEHMLRFSINYQSKI
jgi:hypothetical protein